MPKWEDNTYRTLKAINSARAIRRRRVGKRLWNLAVGKATRRLFR